jgi:Tfp pilus assembly protein PilZ
MSFLSRFKPIQPHPISIAIVSDQGLASPIVENFTSYLRSLIAGGEDSANIKIENHHFTNFHDFATFLTSGNPLPHLLLITRKDSVPPRSHANNLKTVFRELRRNDPNIGIFLFCDEIPAGQEIMHWFDAGATGFFSTQSEIENIDDAVEDLLYRRLTTQTLRRVRLPSTHCIEINIPSLQQALVAETLNLGTGGMFVRMAPRDIKLGDTVQFSLNLNSRAAATQSRADDVIRPDELVRMEEASVGSAIESSIKGIGKIAWVRHQAEEGLPEGIGIQFNELEANGQNLITEFVKNHGTHAFIPKA